MNGHYIRGNKCVRCTRTERDCNRLQSYCPRVPWHVDVPEGLSSQPELRARGLRPIGERVAVTMTQHRQFVNLYRDEETVPVRKDTPAMQAARAATWKKTQEKWRCKVCDRVPASIGVLTSGWCQPGRCQDCEDQEEWKAQQAREFARMEM